jgi:hypothetical protein
MRKMIRYFAAAFKGKRGVPRVNGRHRREKRVAQGHRKKSFAESLEIKKNLLPLQPLSQESQSGRGLRACSDSSLKILEVPKRKEVF